MSSSRHVSDGLKQAAMAEKSNFLRTCNLLRRYIKEKGSLRDLNLEIEGKVENLEEIVNPGSSLAASKRNDSGKPGRQMDMSSQVSGPGCSIIEVEDSSPNKTSTSKEDKRAQLTIFYSGKVLIFDDYPADKARELVSVAKRTSSQMSYGILPGTPSEKPSHAARDGLPPRPQPARQQQQGVGGGNACKEKTNSGPPALPSGLPPRPQSAAGCKEKSKQESSGSDLPIARRSSIHRFLEKRKDRAGGRGPYQNQGPEAGGSSNMGDQQLDLNL